MAGAALPVLPRWWWKVDDRHPPPIDPDTGFFVEARNTQPPIAPRAMTLAALADRPCLVLLGEAGSGKSTEVEVAQEALRGDGQCVQWRPLGAIEGSSELREQLREALGVARQAKVVHLFLDALDEAVTSVARIAEVIGDVLGGDLDALRFLRLRILCRSAALPPTLVKRLRERYGSDGVEQYTLLPLRAEDVTTALRASFTEPQLERFLCVPLAPLAARPLTLGLLAGSQPLDKATTAYEVFCDAMPTLLPDHERGANDRTTLLRRQFLARSMAVASLLGGKPQVPVSSGWSPSRSALATEDFAAIAPPEEIVALVRSAALFVDRHFAHRSYTEHLAAEQLTQHHDTTAVLDLLFLPNQPGSRVVPQLRGLAVLLAARRRFFLPLLVRDSVTLLDVDPHFVNDEERACLIDAVLSRSSALVTLGGSASVAERLAAFSHQGIAPQLLRCITRQDTTKRVRTIAIRVASRLRCEGIAASLATIALDRDQPMQVRIAAAGAVGKFGDRGAVRSLRPLLDEQEGTEDQDDLRGLALQALWPHELSPVELFLSLSVPRHTEFSGGEYHTFVEFVLPGSLQRNAVPAALGWCAANLNLQTDWPPDELVRAILKLAVDSLDDPMVLQSLAEWFVAMIGSHQHPAELLREALKASAETHRDRLRWTLLSLFVPRCCQPPQGQMFSYYLEPLIVPNDAIALLDRARGAPTEDEARLWIELAVRTQQARESWELAVTERLLTYFEAPDSPERKAMSWIWEPWMLDEERVRLQRERVQRRHRSEQKRHEAEERRRTMLEQYRSAACGGDLDGFWQWVVWTRTKVTNNGRISVGRTPPIATSPAWMALSASEQRAMLDTADEYLRRWSLDTDWFGGNTVPWSALAGRHALVLLATLDPKRLDALDAGVWRRWTPALLSPEWTTEEAPRALSEPLLQRAYAADGAAYRALAMTLLRAASGGVLEMDIVTPVIDNDFINLLDEFAHGPELAATAFSEVLRAIAKHDEDRAWSLASTVIVRDWDDTSEHAERGVRAAAWLLRTRPETAWPTLVPYFARRPERGAEAVLKASVRGETMRWSPGFTEASSFVSFYVWGQQTLGTDAEPRHDEPYVVTPRQNLRWTLEEVRQRLTALGTEEALAALKDLQTRFPADAYLPRALELAQERLLENTWRGHSPRELVAIFCPVPAPSPA